MSQLQRPDFPPFIFPNVTLSTTAGRLPFASYPARIGWSIIAGSWTTKAGTLPTQAQLVGFFQSWLFFGAISELCDIFRLDIDIDKEFISPGTNGRLLSTEPLNVLRERLCRARSQLDPAGARERDRRLAECRSTIDHELGKKGPDPSSRCIDKRKTVNLEFGRAYQAVAILLRVLALVGEPCKRVGGSFDWALHYSASAALPQRGWCPSEVHMLSMNIETEVAFLASTLERPLMFRNHEGCDNQRCFADQVVEDRYETVHVQFGCRCDSVAVQGEDLKAVLERGKIPKISLAGLSEAKQTSDLEIVEDAPYLAISHVCKSSIMKCVNHD